MQSDAKLKILFLLSQISQVVQHMRDKVIYFVYFQVMSYLGENQLPDKILLSQWKC